MIVGADAASSASSYAIGWANHPLTFAIERIAEQITADKSPLFPTGFVTSYRFAILPKLNMVDPDDVEPYVLAWVRAGQKSGQSFTAQRAMDAMVAEGLDASRSQEVANAMYRAKNAGVLTQAEVLNPAGANAKVLDQVLEAPGKLVSSATKAVESTGSLIEWVPTIALGLAVLAGAYVALPYLQTARAVGSRARKVAR